MNFPLASTTLSKAVYKMTKEQFLKQLQAGISKLPVSEQQDILQDYEEHFLFGGEAGETEAEIAEALGSPTQLARELMAGYHVDQAAETKSADKIFKAILAIGGLGFLNLVFVLAPALAIFGVIFSFWAVAISFITTPVLIVLFGLINVQTFEWHNFFASLVLCGLGIFIFMGIKWLTKIIINITLKYLRFNLRIIKGDKS